VARHQKRQLRTGSIKNPHLSGFFLLGVLTVGVGMDDAKARLYVAIHHHGAGKHADGPYPQTIIAIQGAVYHQDFFGFRMVGAAQYFVLLAFVMLVNTTGNVVHNDFVWMGS
jgi:hypothetical protein